MSDFSFPQADNERKKPDPYQVSIEKQCRDALNKHLASGEWRYTGFQWEGKLPASIVEQLKRDGWNWKEDTWFEPTATHSKEVRGYKFE